ncbi:hypothetical protein ACFL5V_07500 [Fibrobacterota bacterium]
MSIRWIRNILVDEEAVTLEVFLGDYQISDKCYVRVNSGPERWFVPKGETRDGILQQGIEILREQFKGKKITYANGNDFNWK